MTCKDCIHYKVCKIIDMAGIWEKAELCECFKAANLVVELPCKVGDTVYYWVDRDTKFQVLFAKPFEISDLDYIGKSIFLTREEAEKALEGMK